MAKVVLAPQVRADLDRILDHLLAHDAVSAIERTAAITAAFDVLESSPHLGRPVEQGMRELVIGSGATGSVALYRFASELDIVFVLGIRAQREAGYRER